MPELNIAVIAGDGIGQEVVPSAIRCLRRVGEVEDIRFDFLKLDWGSERYLATGTMMPADGLDQIAHVDAIFLGAVGHPNIPDTETLWGLLIPLRRGFRQYINLRPVKTLPGVLSPLSRSDAIDFLIVRENNEGEYSDVGGRYYRGQPEECALQTSVFTRAGIQRVARFAVDRAGRRKNRVVSATKSNGIIHTMPFWDEIVAEVVAGSPEISLESVLIDALAARMVLRPASLDVVLASNLFGDILSDLGSALTGSIGVAPSANLNPERDFPSLFEPVHGTAPDIAGKGLANPVGQIWSGAMMLDHLGLPRAAARLTMAFESALRAGISTRDLGGTAGTKEFTDAVVERIA